MALAVLDTDVASHLIKGTLPDALKTPLVGQQPLISFVTVGELVRWLHLRELGERRQRAIDRWIGSQHVIGGSPEVARRWGRSRVTRSAVVDRGPTMMLGSRPCVSTTTGRSPPSTFATTPTSWSTKVSDWFLR